MLVGDLTIRSEPPFFDACEPSADLVRSGVCVVPEHMLDGDLTIRSGPPFFDACEPSADFVRSGVCELASAAIPFPRCGFVGELSFGSGLFFKPVFVSESCKTHSAAASCADASIADE